MNAIEIPGPSSAALLPGIVDRPVQTLAEVIARPRWRWVLPAVLTLAGLAIFLVVARAQLVEQAQEQQALAMQSFGSQLGDMPAEQQEQVTQQMERFGSPAFVLGSRLIAEIASLILAWLIGALILFFGELLRGRQIGYNQVFAGFSWTWFPFALRYLVETGWVLVSGQLVANPGLSYFVASGDPMADAANPLWRLAGYVDVFALWHVVLVYCLTRAMDRKGSVVITAVYAVLSLALRVIPALGLASLGPRG
jgi:hypothetical protein